MWAIIVTCMGMYIRWTGYGLLGLTFNVFYHEAIQSIQEINRFCHGAPANASVLAQLPTLDDMANFAPLGPTLSILENDSRMEFAMESDRFMFERLSKAEAAEWARNIHVDRLSQYAYFSVHGKGDFRHFYGTLVCTILGTRMRYEEGEFPAFAKSCSRTYLLS